MTKAVLAAAVFLAFVAYLVAHHAITDGRGGRRQAASVANPAGDPVAAQFIYTPPTANDAKITLPESVQSELLQIGLANQSIALIRVAPDGNVSKTYIDMTPRTGNSPADPPLKVNARAVPVIEAKISAIEKAINSAASTGGQALFAGLTRTDFTSTPVVIVSTGLDLANPDNFRSLNWSYPAKKLAAELKKAGDLPALHGRVTFVTVPTAGRQPQLGHTQKKYRKAVWRALLKAAGATSVNFIDANGSRASGGAPRAPVVPVQALLPTPIQPVPAGNKSVSCTLPSSYFVFKTAKLVDAATTEQNLAPCISAALAAHATFALAGWASYQGPLNPNGKPAFDYRYNRQLSKKRVQAIANLLVNDLGVPRSGITGLTWHGNLDQPDPGNPGSPANQVVRITYTAR